MNARSVRLSLYVANETLPVWLRILRWGITLDYLAMLRKKERNQKGIKRKRGREGEEREREEEGEIKTEIEREKAQVNIHREAK